MSVALHGNLKDFGIAEVFQLIGQQRKTGMLEISGDGYRVHLAFDQGSVVWAAPVGESEYAALGERLVRCGLITRSALDEYKRESEASARPLPSLLVADGAVRDKDLEEILDLLSRETIFEVMRWTGGSFHFKAQPIHHEVPPENLLGAEQILMDGLRMLDEWQTFHDQVPSDDTIFERVGRLDLHREPFGQMSQQRKEQIARVYRLVDGRMSARRIIDLSRLGTFEATRVLAELSQHGLVTPVSDDVARRLRRSQRASVPVVKQVRWGFAAAFPLALLALVVLVGLRERPLDQPVDGTAIARRPLEEVGQRFARKRLYNALEAQRLLSGDWPDDLSEPAASEVLDRFVMAPHNAHLYYYAKQEGGILLLEPAR